MTPSASSRRTVSAGTLATAVSILALAGPAFAQFMTPERGYVGPAYLELPGVKGDAKLKQYKNWIRTEAHVWKRAGGPPMRRPAAAPSPAPAAAQQGAAEGQASAQRPAQAQRGNRGGGGLGGRRAQFSLPGAPESGEGTLIVTVDKRSPVLRTMMANCQSKATIPEASYSVSSDRSRAFNEMGPRPSGVPDYFEYKLRNLQFVDCPTAEGAPEQAFVVKFDNIEWTNWAGEKAPIPVKLEPAKLAPLPQLTGATKTWVVSWFALANHVSDDQCPKMHERPSEADYYALLPKEEADRERAKLAGQGGPNYQSGQMGLRGPGRLNVTYLPGIVPDPGLPEPQTKAARGLDLDGDKGRKPIGRNFVSEDGKIAGIDNQLYTVEGCIAGWQGPKGFILQFANNQMRDGAMSMIVQINGIDNERNDDEVYVTWLYSLDAMAKSASGAKILADYSFISTDDPQYSHYFKRVRARIKDGVVETDPVDFFDLNLGVFGLPPELRMSNSRMRLTLNPDGTIKGVLGGYVDWRRISSTYVSSAAEFYHGFQQPALYNALKRNADGLKDPVTGEYTGISAAYDIEGVPAFVLPSTTTIATKN